MGTGILLDEMRAARAALTAEHRVELLEHGVPADLIGRYSLIGAARIRINAGLYDPVPDGRPAFITPALIDNPLTPEAADPLACARVTGDLVDLVAWHPRHPSRWALRVGSATWLGATEPQYMEPDPVAVRRSPLSWLRADCDGLVILSTEPAEAYRLLSSLHAIIAEDAQHVAELRRLVRQPWPLPSIRAAAHDEVSHAA